MSSYALAPQVPPYIPNPAPSAFPPAPCADASVTPEKVCGTVAVTGGGTGTLTEVEWAQLAYTSSGTPNAATALSSSSLKVRKAVINAPSTNAAAVNLGPTSAASLDSLGAGVSGYIIEMPDGTAFDLANWYAKSASASQSLVIAYLPA